MMRATSAFLFAALLAAQDDQTAKGIGEFHKGQYEAAVQTLELAPDGPHRQVFLALSRAGLGRCDLASADLAKQFESNPDSELKRLAGLALVRCDMAQGRSNDSYPVLARLQTLYPADADVLYQAARFHMKAWNDTLNEMFQKTPASFRVNQISAEVFEIQGRYTEAASEYRKAIGKNPSALNLHFQLGRALLLESHAPENLPRARAEFEAELALNPADAAAEYQVGQILVAENKPADASARFEHALARKPDFPEALQALARRRAEEKRYPEAIRLLEKVIGLQPLNEGAHYNLMMAYRDSGRLDDANREKAVIEKLQRSPEGEFSEFLKKLGEKPAKP